MTRVGTFSLAGKMDPTFTYGGLTLVSNQAELKLEQSFMSQQSEQSPGWGGHFGLSNWDDLLSVDDYILVIPLTL